ncbi:MAG: M23 family metallopeptidase [Betaproteobacteria bacterium]
MQKSGILSQPVIERLKRHRLAFGITGALATLGMAAAVAVVPDNDRDVRIQTVVENLALESFRPLDLTGNSYFREERIRRGDTVGAVLARLGIQDSEAASFIQSAPGAQAIHRQLVPGKVVVAQSSAEGELHRLIFPLNGKDAALIIERKGGKLTANEQALRFERREVMKAAEIRSSLFAATDASDIPDSIATQLADIFGSDIDFHRDLRKGDRFSVIYEMDYLRGQPARTGRILSAEFVNGGKTLRAIYFEQDGKGAYYTTDGKSLRKAFLRSPLEFSRVTSGFAMRFHPILRDWRAHKGVDYGAPSGTVVRATADGTVDFVGKQGGYGNMIILRHQGAYSTAYGHLRGFASGLRKGSRVSQGETIGFVGQTGWATGPHLHYEFRISNQQVNPLSVTLPTAMPLDAAQLNRFKATAQNQLDQLNLLRDTRVAILD